MHKSEVSKNSFELVQPQYRVKAVPNDYHLLLSESRWIGQLTQKLSFTTIFCLVVKNQAKSESECEILDAKNF